MELETERLILKYIKIANAERIAKLANDREIADTTIIIPHPFTLNDAISWIVYQQSSFEEGISLAFGIFLKEELIGILTLGVDRDNDAGELGYWIGKDYWGNGYATEATRIALKLAFKRLSLNRVHGLCMARNKASGRVLEKIGMKKEGLLRDYWKKWESYEDVEVYSILKGDLHGSVS